jgi:hypothetical protein
MHRSEPRSCLGAAAALAAFLILALAGTASAKPPIRQSFFGAYPAAVGTRLDNLPSHATHCGVCHFDFNGGGARNPYGVRLGNVIGGYPNNDAGRQQAMHSIENEDSDGDGYTQLDEITNTVTYSNTPTFPGLTPGNVGSTSNVPQLSEISGFLVPTIGSDVTPPTISVLAPDGAESWTGGTAHAITWTANDNIGVTAVDLYYRDAETNPWSPLAVGLANSGTWTWFVHNTPTAAARVRAVARDAAGNSASDQSAALFTIVATPGGIAPTTLRDFHQPGTQPLSGASFQDHNSCASCHGGYNPAVEPAHNFRGTMMAQAARDPLFFACMAIAEQDAPGSGDLCLRCHTPFGWLSGRSQPTSGAGLIALDRDGVSCDFCHSAVNPIYQAGVSPPEDEPILNGLLPAHLPANHANGQYVVDPQTRRRGPFADAVAPHAFLESPFHRSSEFCGTCHDVSNPVFNRVSGPDYAPGPLDQKATSFLSTDLLPLERTYSEWKNSAYPGGVYAPEFAGNKPDGIVSTCQDCHMRDVSGTGCNDPGAPTRPDLPLHDMTGGNTWLPSIIAALDPGETDAAALSAGAARATAMLQKAATVAVNVVPEASWFRAQVTVTNRTGHKLPTGYPEGRRMWLHVIARDDQNAVVYESGAYSPGTGVLTHDADATIYEIEIGLSPAFAQAIGQSSGPSFHFALNDSVYRDNRIPPLGFTNAAFATFGGQPLDPSQPAPRYPDGQNWDRPEYLLPLTARTVTATLYYQTTSKEFVEFLRDANVTNTAGQQMYDLWTANGRAAPVAMATGSATFGPVAVDPDGAKTLEVRAANNPFRGPLELLITLPRPGPVTLEIFDVSGRLVSRLDRGALERGPHGLIWDGRDRTGADAGSGLFWATVRAGDESRVVRVARVR